MKKIYEYIYPTIINQDKFIPLYTDTLPGLNQPVIVFKNGIIPLNAIVIVEETITKVLITSSTLSLDDYIVIQTSSNLRNVVGDRSDSIFKRYGNAAEPRLFNNQSYVGSFNLDNVETIDISFNSRYNPFYSNTKLIRNDIEHLVSITDAAIDYLIYDYSSQVASALRGDGDLSYSLPLPQELQDIKKIPYNIQQHVRYAVEYDIINNAYMMMANKSGKRRKKLADLEIEEDVTLPKLDDFLRLIKQKLEKFKLTGSSIMSSFIKASSTEPYPLIVPRRNF